MRLSKDKDIYKRIILLAIPMMLQNLITYSVGLADNLMIGSLGDSAISGVYMGNQVQTVLQVLNAGIEGGILLISAQYWGKKDTKSIQKITSIGLWFSLILGLVFSVITTFMPRQVISIFTNVDAVIDNGVSYLSFLCFSYVFFSLTQALLASMRSVESPRIGLIVSLSSLFIDVILNYLLIFGKAGLPAMGVRGAALATLIARIRMMRTIDKVLLRDFLKYGAPLVAGQLVWGVNLFSNSIILGHLGESVTTAVSIANTLNNLMYVGINGLAAAVGIVTGKKVGAGDIGDIREYSNSVQLIFFVIGLLSAALLFVICDPFISLYDITAESAICSRQFIRVLCITAIGTCYQYPCLFGLVKFLGCPAWVVFFCLKSDQIFKCVVAFFKIRRYDWMKNLTTAESRG